MNTDIFNVSSPAWMEHPRRNCAIPDEFLPHEVRDAADMWFPTEATERRYAKRLCIDCPVARQCFMYALERPELDGIWGGTSANQREKLRAAANKRRSERAA